jgi:hypothetical protein
MAKRRIRVPKPPCTPEPPRPPGRPRPPGPGEMKTGPDPREIVRKLIRKRKRS